MTFQSPSRHLINFTAKRMLKYYPDKERIAKIILGTSRIDPIVLFPATENMRKRIEKNFRKKSLTGQVTRLHHAGHRFSLCNSGVGAPSTEIILTALLAGGARTVLRFDVCGSLSEELPVGFLFLAESACAYDGVSKLYWPHQKIDANPDLVETVMQTSKKTGITLNTGTIATVDFFFAQTLEHHREWARTAQAVDMETAAIYAICSAHNVRAVSVMCVSDVKLFDQDPFLHDSYDFAGFRSGLKDLSRIIPGIVAHIATEFASEQP